MIESAVKVGCVFNGWTVLSKVPKEVSLRRTLFVCKCVCGKEKLIYSANLISGKSKSCGCVISGRDWAPSEIDILKQNYFSSSVEILLDLLPRRTWEAVKLMAAKLSIKRDGYRSGDVSVLLEESPEAYYWSGFIAADGHIASDKRLTVTLAIKDLDHLKKFANFIKCDNYREYLNRKYPNCNVAVQDPTLVKSFAQKFGFNSNKTVLPPNLEWMSGDPFIAFLCGFIDGDGCINNQYLRKDCKIVLKGHNSWIRNYIFFENQVYKECMLEKYKDSWGTHINKKGYVVLNLCDRKIINFLKIKTIDLCLPVLSRKWNKIDIYLPESRYETAKRTKARVLSMDRDGASRKEISKSLDISNGYISMILSGRR
jgi:hypothetical protein